MMHIDALPAIHWTTPSTIFITDKTIPFFLLHFGVDVMLPTAVRVIKYLCLFCFLFPESESLVLCSFLGSCDCLFVHFTFLQRTRFFSYEVSCLKCRNAGISALFFRNTCAFLKWIYFFREGLLQENSCFSHVLVH